ncbi:MAG: hypothetical protein JJU11_17815 [Candidatus Sumerlaeia bacterium]|nr:hypothetical protein [Candidatus Sumerlaeia bacterium]
MAGILDKLLDLEKTPTARKYGKEEYGLDRFGAFLESLGSPQRHLHFIHIAGTKGKGSTAAFCESILRAAGFPTALYSSPHLEHFGERFRFNGSPWTSGEFESALEAFYTRLDPAQQRTFDGPHAYRTVFEVLTALALTAFLDFQKELQRASPSGLPLIVCWETGLGGRLDCTNVVDPLVAVLTAIGLDHVGILGNDIRAIAGEKAGIIKKGRPAIVCRQEPEAIGTVMDVFRNIAAEKGAPVVRAWEHNPCRMEGGDCVYTTPDGINGRSTPGLAGEFQAGNIEGAIAACWYTAKHFGGRLDEGAIRQGLAGVSWPGRLESHRDAAGRLLLLDGAHCPLSARALGAAAGKICASRVGEGVTLLLGMQGDKDHAGFVSALIDQLGREKVRRLVLYTIPGPRGGSAGRMAAEVEGLGLPVTIVEEPAAALLESLQEPGMVVSTGTLYTIGEFRRIFRERFC